MALKSKVIVVFLKDLYLLVVNTKKKKKKKPVIYALVKWLLIMFVFLTA